MNKLNELLNLIKSSEYFIRFNELDNYFKDNNFSKNIEKYKSNQKSQIISNASNRDDLSELYKQNNKIIKNKIFDNYLMDEYIYLKEKINNLIINIIEIIEFGVK